jgi:predicted nucleotidyltransferase
MKKLEKIITEFRQALEKIYGDKLINLVLYGSQARGDATEDSDIDIMVWEKLKIKLTLNTINSSQFCPYLKKTFYVKILLY